jgi:DNA invertase Pin-like site-specific DNA recombinase
MLAAAWIAEQEQKRISERTKAGLQTARLRGKVLARSGDEDRNGGSAPSARRWRWSHEDREATLDW